jgi:hypothetical protein
MRVRRLRVWMGPFFCAGISIIMVKCEGDDGRGAQMNQVTHAVRNPRGIPLIIGMAGLSFNFWIMVRRLDEDSGAMDYFVTWGTFFIVVTVLLVTVYRTLQKPTELRLEEGRILLKGRILPAEDIRVIMLRGYFSPVIGIKPYGKRIVPVPFCFRFARDQDQGQDDLIKWARDNGVKLVYKRFIRWL